jgi:hypothetical protein
MLTSSCIQGFSRQRLFRTAVLLGSMAALPPVASAAARPVTGNRLDVAGEEVGAARLEKLFLRNLSARPAAAVLESATGEGRERLALPAGALVEASGSLSTAGRLAVRSDADLLVLRTSADFEADQFEVAGRPRMRIERTPEKATARVEWPRWELALLAARDTSLAAGQTGHAALPAEPPAGARADLAVQLLDPGSSVAVRLLDATGGVVRSAVLSSTQPLRLRADLGELAGGESLEVEVVRGRASAATGVARPGARAGAYRPIFAASISGSASVNHEINWAATGDLYYYVQGGPANTCGSLDTLRNGSALSSPGWLCTDGSGNATKGPWSWSGTPSDQTDEQLHITWPDGSTTNDIHHIWDKTCATTNSGIVSGSNYTGSATDAQWGAGFDASWTQATCTFYDSTSNRWWAPGHSGYDSTSEIAVAATVTGMPGFSVTWSCPAPPFSYHDLEWTVCVTDGSCGTCSTIFQRSIS